MVFQLIGVVLLICFYGCYFIKMGIQHQRGIRTDQIGKGKNGIEKSIEIIMKIITIIVPIIEIISIFLNTNVSLVIFRIMGVLTGTVGLIVFIISVLTMKDSWRAGVSTTDKTELVTEGIYRISRNPAFLGFDLVYIGITITFFNWILFIISLLAIVIFHLQIILVEEKFLIKTFNKEYEEYTENVNRYLGRKRKKNE